MRVLLILLLLSFACTCGRAQTDDAYRATVRPAAAPDPEPVTDLLYGQFIEHLGRCVDGGIYDPGSPRSDERGFRTDVLELVRELNVPLLRFPGGTVTKIYDWKNGIGPLAERKKRPNLIWGGNIQYGFGTAEFVAYCREIGAEPMLVVNMATDSPLSASEWVEYCNGTGDTHWANLRRQHGYPEPFNVKYWGIGNEESAQPDAGRHYVVDDYIADTWQFLKLMKLQDPTIDVTVVGDTRDQAWNRRVLADLHPAADHLAVHFYAVPNDSTYPALLRSVYQYDAYLDTMRRHLAPLPPTGGLSRWYRFAGRAQPLKLAVDEWGIWNMDSPKGRGAYRLEYPFHWGHALGTAAFLNMFYRHHDLIGLATWAQTVNVLAPIMTSPDSAWTQTVYRPLVEYRRRMLPRHLPLTVSAPPTPGAPLALDAVATMSEDGRELTMALINLDPERWADVNVELAGYGAKTLHVYNSTDVYDTRPINESLGLRGHGLPDDGTLYLPPASISFLSVRR